MGIKFLLYILFFISLISNSILSKADVKPSGLTLKLLHRDSIESNNLTRIEKFQKIIERSNIWANQLMISTASASQPTYHHPALRHEYLNYVVELRVGTPAVPKDYPYYLLLDTATELTWLQCDGCKYCFKQRQPWFSHDDSSTYELLPCDHKLCKAYECNHNHCKFKEWDSPDVHVEGFMSKDVFTFPTEAGDNFTVLVGVVFGCAYGIVGFPFLENPSYNINGVFGLGPGPRSFTSQFAPQQRFGYCLADWHFGPPKYPGQLLFGDDALLPSSGHVQITPIVETDTRSYFVKLMDIEINNKTLEFEEGIFYRKHDVNGTHGGFLIDSGSAVSYFSPEVYYVVRQEFVDYMKTLNLKQIIPPRKLAELGMDLCWGFSNGTDIESGLPSMLLNFQDHDPDKKAELIIQPISLFFIEMNVENPHMCLGIVQNKGMDPHLNILGGKQQTGNKFSFDVQNNTISWMSMDCGSPPN